MTAKELINNSDMIDWWQKKDLYDLLDKYPEIEIATREQLEEFAQKRYWDVQVLMDEVDRIESEADQINMFLKWFYEELHKGE
jgi:hypothetical protein